MRAFFLLSLLLLMGDALATPARVLAVQAPAWRIHEGTRSALAPGLALAARDSIETGAGARVVLGLAEGSTVKLGENAALALTALEAPAREEGVFKGFLDVVRGAFRFTTTVVGRQRDIKARVGTATIGIRGTDVWGKHEASRDFVVLLEGHIDIERGGQTVAMTEAQSLFMAPAGAAALPVAPVDPDDLARWAQETELQVGGGQRDGQGAFRLMFKLETDRAVAAALVERLSRAGHGAQLMEEGVAPHMAWRAVISGYTSEAEAQAAAAAIKDATDARPWLRR